MAISHITDSDFSTFVSDGIAVVDFWAQWCGPCRSFGPIFEQVSDGHPSIKFGKYEITDTNRAAAAKYNVRSIPCIIAFKNGEVVEQKVGLMDDDSFNNWIKELES